MTKIIFKFKEKFAEKVEYPEKVYHSKETKKKKEEEEEMRKAT